jgi:hypothetical protein
VTNYSVGELRKLALGKCVEGKPGMCPGRATDRLTAIARTSANSEERHNAEEALREIRDSDKAADCAKMGAQSYLHRHGSDLKPAPS